MSLCSRPIGAFMTLSSNNSPGKIRANPEQEDFRGKYEEKNPISRYLVNNYFRSVAKLLARVEAQKSLRALEIGCGEGFSTRKLIELLPSEASLEASEYLQRQVDSAAKMNPTIRIIQEDVYSLKRENRSFDLVFLLEVLEHLDYPEKALQEIGRISRRHLILGVPREPIWCALNMCRGKYWAALGNTPGHLNHWSSSGIVKFVEKNFGPVVAVEKPLPWTIVLAENLNFAA
jgi:SAM-dependent methyltransferase